MTSIYTHSWVWHMHNAEQICLLPTKVRGFVKNFLVWKFVIEKYLSWVKFCSRQYRYHAILCVLNGINGVNCVNCVNGVNGIWSFGLIFIFLVVSMDINGVNGVNYIHGVNGVNGTQII